MVKHARYFRLLVLFLLVCSLSACQKQPAEVVFAGPIMGTDYRITLVTAQDDAAVAQVQKRVLDAMEAVNQSMSTYIESSEISKFNRLPKGESLVLSEGMRLVVNESLAISRLTDGAFDATLGKAIRLWGFSEDGKILKEPTETILAKLRPSTGYQYLELRDDLKGYSLSKLADGLELNLSAIAKGYAVDRVADVLVQHGFNNYLINIGGELRAKGLNSEGQLWRVGIERPHILGGVAQVVKLDSMAIATSGDYRNFITLDGQKFSHTIDIKTLKPVFHKLASVSVLSEKASTADALATALMVMGEVDGVEFAEKHKISAYFIIRGESADDYRTKITGQFELILQE